MQTQDDDIMGKAYDARLMRRLLSLVRPYRWMAVVSVILLIAAQGFSAYRPKLVQEAVDAAILAGDGLRLRNFAILFVVLLIGEFLLQYCVIYVTQLMGQRIIFDLRMKLFTHLEHLHLQFFDRNPVGRLITRVTSDIESLNDMFTSGLVYLFGDIFLLAGIIVMMFVLDVHLTLVTLAILPLIFYISVVFKSKVRVAFREVRLKIAALNSYLQENITGVTTVQIFNREKKNFEKFDALNRTLTDSHLDSVFHYAWFYPAINVASSFAIGMLIWYGSGEVRSSSITLGTLIAFIQYGMLFFRPIQDLSDKYNILQTAMASSERVFKLIDTPTEIPNPAQPITPKVMSGRIEFRNVYFAYNPQDIRSDEDYILKDISFVTQPGQSVALVGATGSGKSTIIN
ncbi:MAG TPA: ABC transporter transmembrane domain-containing protein, partial [bacterium]|nr:ABC transporter transmembrane domain-containing protein [bacterium]